jgi:predicted ATPase/DNA-binding NarL/FixJ family response regulator
MTLRTNIPTALTSFIGRKREISEAVELLATSRLVTLIGAPGCGKTRLALRVVAAVSRRYQDGVHWIELAQLVDPELVPQAITKALRLPEQRGRPAMEGLLDALQHKHLLLILDNCEHVLKTCTQLAESLLGATEVGVLTTSREPLGVAGERRYPVSLMALPPAGLAVHDLEIFDAIQLFVERARAILPDFALTPNNAEAVASICRCLDGIPLAIELACARVNVLAPEQIAARLDDRFDLLASAAHVTRSHHRTLRAAFDWSYDLLSLPEQVLLQRLSIFAAGCSLATAEAVCTGNGVERHQQLELLSSLVDKCLIVAHTLQRSEARYSMLETIRQYAQEKLKAAGDWPATCDRHLQCFLRLTEETLPKLSGPYQRLWLNWLEDEYHNICAALVWAQESDQIEVGLRIAIAIYQFWTIRDYVEEGLTWMERLLARVAQAREPVSPTVHANSLAYAAFLAGFRGKTSAQMEYGREAAVIAEAAGEEGKPALVWALAAQAFGARAVGDYRAELSLGMQGIQLLRELGNRFQLGLTLSITSFSAMALGDYGTAHAMLDEALPLLREVGNPYRIAMALNFSGDLARCEQNYAAAQPAYEESVNLLRKLDAPRDLASALHNLGHTCLHQGDVERAQALFGESMTIQLAQRNTPGMAECLIGFAALASWRDLSAAAARLLAAAVAIGGQRIASAWAATRMEYEHYLALVRSSLTEAELLAELAAGRAFSLEQAIEYAQNLPLRPTVSVAIRENLDDLSQREREVAALIARGRTNGEIADDLVVSKRTVETHIAHILSKLGFTNRAQIVRWAIENGLVK